MRFISRANSALGLRFFSKLWVAEDDTAGLGAIMRGILRKSFSMCCMGRCSFSPGWMRAGNVRPVYETNEGGGKFPEKGNLRGNFGGFGGNAAAWTEKVPIEVKKYGNPKVFSSRQAKSCMGVSAPKGSRRRPQSPLVTPAGAIPPATIKIKKHGCALRRFPKGDRRLRLFSLPFGRLRRGEISCLRERTAMSARPAAWSRPFGATMCK